MPRPKASASTVETCGFPTVVKMARVRAKRPPAVCVAKRMVRLLERSTTSPPHVPAISMGRNWRAIVIPSMKPLPVRSRISQLWATDCIHVPETEIPCPMK